MSHAQLTKMHYYYKKNLFFEPKITKATPELTIFHGTGACPWEFLAYSQAPWNVLALVAIWNTAHVKSLSPFAESRRTAGKLFPDSRYRKLIPQPHLLSTTQSQTNQQMSWSEKKQCVRQLPYGWNFSVLWFNFVSSIYIVVELEVFLCDDFIQELLLVLQFFPITKSTLVKFLPVDSDPKSFLVVIPLKYSCVCLGLAFDT